MKEWSGTDKDPLYLSARDDSFQIVDGKLQIVIVDIDGTLAIHNGRSPYEFFKLDTDLPNQPVIEVVRALHDAGYGIIYLSGREEKYRVQTARWLATHVVVPANISLLMRLTGDYRADDVIKREIYYHYIEPYYGVLCVLDDRNRVVEMWRKLGLTVLQVADGDF